MVHELASRGKMGIWWDFERRFRMLRRDKVKPGISCCINHVRTMLVYR